MTRIVAPDAATATTAERRSAADGALGHTRLAWRSRCRRCCSAGAERGAPRWGRVVEEGMVRIWLCDVLLSPQTRIEGEEHHNSLADVFICAVDRTSAEARARSLVAKKGWHVIAVE